MAYPYHTNSFVLRIWWEQDPGGAFWRGWIQHAASGESCYFERLADMLAFIEAQTGPLASLEAGLTQKTFDFSSTGGK